jgi:hypothetical protein
MSSNSPSALAAQRVLDDLASLDLANTTPLEALLRVADWQQRMRAAELEQVGPRALAVADGRRETAQAD